MYYHMYGSGIGSLDIYTHGGDSTKTQLHLQGSQANAWRLRAVSIPPQTSSVRNSFLHHTMLMEYLNLYIACNIFIIAIFDNWSRNY